MEAETGGDLGAFPERKISYTSAEATYLLADACLVRMSEELRDCRVFTVDRNDFTVYRRLGRQTIPLIAPP
jgi:hypothetical protein